MNLFYIFATFLVGMIVGFNLCKNRDRKTLVIIEIEGLRDEGEPMHALVMAKKNRSMLELSPPPDGIKIGSLQQLKLLAENAKHLKVPLIKKERLITCEGKTTFIVLGIYEAHRV